MKFNIGEKNQRTHARYADREIMNREYPENHGLYIIIFSLIIVYKQLQKNHVHFIIMIKKFIKKYI